MASQQYVLQITEGPDVGLCFGIAGESVLIGRAAECDIRLENARGVSRNHCRVFVMESGLRVQDQGSQNGVYIQGKRITDAIIKPGVSFKVGEVVFLAQTAEALGGQYALAAADPAALAATGGPGGALAAGGGSNPLAAAGGANNIEKAQELMEAAGENSRKVLLQLGILIGIIVAGLYLIKLVSTSDYFNPVFALVKSYEPKAINFGMDFANYEIKGKSKQGLPVIRMEDYRSLLRPSLDLLKNNKNAPKRRMMIVSGVSEGDAMVELKDGGGTVVRRFRVVCRGVNPYYVPMETMSADQIRELAEQEVAQAQFYVKDNRLYDAWAHYQKAAELYNHEKVNNIQKAGLAGVEAENLKTQLANRLCKLFNDALAAAFPAQINISKPDYPEALILLDEAKSLIPDEKSVDRQVIENWMIIIESYNSQSSKTDKKKQ